VSTRAERARVEATPGETARPSKCARATSPPTAAPSYREPPEQSHSHETPHRRRVPDEIRFSAFRPEVPGVFLASPANLMIRRFGFIISSL